MSCLLLGVLDAAGCWAGDWREASGRLGWCAMWLQGLDSMCVSPAERLQPSQLPESCL